MKSQNKPGGFRGFIPKEIPRGRKGITQGISAKTNMHNADYWKKLKKEFQTCTYDRSGAYSEGALPRRLESPFREVDRFGKPLYKGG